VTPASAQAEVLSQLLQTRSFLREVVQRTSLHLPDLIQDEPRFFDDVSRRFRVEVRGTNLFRLSYRAHDPQTGRELVMAALAVRQERLAQSRTGASAAAAAFYRSELGIAQNSLLDAQAELDSFDGAHRPPLSTSDDYVQRQLRLAVEEARARATDLKASIDRSSVMPGILQTADTVDFQIVDQPLQEMTPSGGARSAAVLLGSGLVGGIALVALLLMADIFLSSRVPGDPDVTRLAPATVFDRVPEVAPQGAERELREALAAVAFQPHSQLGSRDT
jgi:uncharacterized protein involved in exopolysaccharide biosynthesis